MHVVPRTAALRQYSESGLASPRACEPTSATAAMVSWCAAQALTQCKMSETKGDTARLSLPLRLAASADNNCGDARDGLQGLQTPHTRASDRSLAPGSRTSRGQ